MLVCGFGSAAAAEYHYWDLHVKIRASVRITSAATAFAVCSLSQYFSEPFPYSGWWAILDACALDYIDVVRKFVVKLAGFESFYPASKSGNARAKTKERLHLFAPSWTPSQLEIPCAIIHIILFIILSLLKNYVGKLIPKISFVVGKIAGVFILSFELRIKRSQGEEYQYKGPEGVYGEPDDIIADR